jgi:signal transduction histidine kinase
MKKQGKIQPFSQLPFHTLTSLRERLAWFINLRWIAVLGILICVPVAGEMLVFNLPLQQVIEIAVLLLSTNIIYFFLARYYFFKHEYEELYFAELQIIIDLIIISFLVHYSGGIGNPFYFLYIVQVILSGILFPGIILPYLNAVFAALLLTFWTLSEHFNLITGFNLREEPVSGTVLTVSLAAFYFTNFAGIYIINNFMRGYRALKSVIDEKNKMLEQSIKDRNKAFRYAAHELKGPVIAIQSSLAVIKSLYSDDLKPEAKDMITKAENRSSQMIDMIKEMISVTQYNLGIEKPLYENVIFDEWIGHLISLNLSYAKRKRINLVFIPSGLSTLVNIDINGMEKVFSNLVSNALRYTPESGNVIVKSFCTEDSYGFYVRDNGIGIEEEDLSKIFEEFYRGKNAREMERIGTGLGLNLVKEIVEFNNGSIYIKSKKGEGSEFTVEFPLSKRISKTVETEESLITIFE